MNNLEQKYQIVRRLKHELANRLAELGFIELRLPDSARRDTARAVELVVTPDERVDLADFLSAEIVAGQIAGFPVELVPVDSELGSALVSGAVRL